MYVLLLETKSMKEYQLFHQAGALKKQIHIPSCILTHSSTTLTLDNWSRAYQLFFKGWPADAALGSISQALEWRDWIYHFYINVMYEPISLL